MYCPQCSTELPDDARYCSECSYDFMRINSAPSPRMRGQDSLDGMGTSFGEDIEGGNFDVGSLFADRYEILSEGLKGGMGAVYKCRDTKLNEIVALKVIHPRLLSSHQALLRFRQEVAISRKLQHPNIVRVFNLEESEGKEYFTMEWIDGVTLREIITNRKKDHHPFNMEEANKIIAQLADALSDAHKHTIHRDIKPENILVSDETGLMVKLTDFGIAKMLSSSEFTVASIQMGTPYYMAPEQKADARNIDKRADIYALGVILFELLTLENTMGLELPSEINKNLPPAIDNIIKKTVATKPEDRYGEAKDLSEALSRVVVEWKKRREMKIQAETRKQTEEQRPKLDEQRKQQEEERKAKEISDAERRRIEDLRRREEEKKEREKLDAEKRRIEEIKGREKAQQGRAEPVEIQKKVDSEKSGKAMRTKIAIAAIVLLLIMVAASIFLKKAEVPSMTTEKNGSVPAEGYRPIPTPIPTVVAPASPGPQISRAKPNVAAKNKSSEAANSTNLPVKQNRGSAGTVVTTATKSEKNQPGTGKGSFAAPSRDDY